MRYVIALVAAAGLASALTGCEYNYTQHEQAYVPASDGYYPTAATGYYPVKTYPSENYYYRHYSGIDG